MRMCDVDNPLVKARAARGGVASKRRAARQRCRKLEQEARKITRVFWQANENQRLSDGRRRRRRYGNCGGISQCEYIKPGIEIVLYRAVVNLEQAWCGECSAGNRRGGDASVLQTAGGKAPGRGVGGERFNPVIGLLAYWVDGVEMVRTELRRDAVFNAFLYTHHLCEVLVMTKPISSTAHSIACAIKIRSGGITKTPILH